jgi:putative acetyltransferase
MKRILFKKKSAKIALGAICVQEFWMLLARKARDRARRVPFELHYASDDEDIQVSYVEDPIADCRYVIVTGQKEERACKLIRQRIPTWSNAGLFEAWDEASRASDRVAAILKIGVAAPSSFERRFAKRLKEGLADENSAVREASLAAIGYQDWPELDPVLRKVARDDTDDRCRKRAAVMLDIRAKEREAAEPRKPTVLDVDQVGAYPAAAKAGGGYVWDEVLEYRVWCHPEQGAADEADGNDYYYAFANYEEAAAFAVATEGAEEPLALVLQREYLDEPEPGRFVHVKKKRITEWPVAFLSRPRRNSRTIPDFLSPDAPSNRLDILRGIAKAPRSRRS